MRYLFDSRMLTHATFWIAYYVFFSLIWAKPEQGYFASFYLEFILMPVRILAVYLMLYVLIPTMLAKQQYQRFLMSYVALILTAGLLQMLFSYVFFSQLMPALTTQFNLSFSGWIRSTLLVNTTVLLLGAGKVFHLYITLQEKVVQFSQAQPEIDHIEVKSDRRMHRLKLDEITYLQGMGNYVTYYIAGGEKRIVYTSLKQAQESLPSYFVRVHRSYVVNTMHIDSYNQDGIFVGEDELPRGKEISDDNLSFPTTNRAGRPNLTPQVF